MSSHISYIIWKAQEANPKLKETTEWCKLRMENWVIYTADGYNSGSFVWISKNIQDWVVFWDTVDVSSSDCEILGHPIQLSDILLALGEKYFCCGDGRITDLLKTPAKYNLTLPLTEQTPETIQWIAEQMGYSS